MARYNVSFSDEYGQFIDKLANSREMQTTEFIRRTMQENYQISCSLIDVPMDKFELYQAQQMNGFIKYKNDDKLLLLIPSEKRDQFGRVVYSGIQQQKIVHIVAFNFCCQTEARQKKYYGFNTIYTNRSYTAIRTPQNEILVNRVNELCKNMTNTDTLQNESESCFMSIEDFSFFFKQIEVHHG